MTTDLDRPAPTSAETRNVTLLTGNCVDRQQLASSPLIVLDGLGLFDAHGTLLARYSAALWGTSPLATSWLRLEGELSLAFMNGTQKTLHHRTYATIELMGLTLWAPQRVMLAHFSQWANCWIDRAGFEYDRITIAPYPPLHELLGTAAR